MLSSGIAAKSVAEQAVELAYETPSSFASDTHTPFHRIGMGELSDEELGKIFENKRVLDIGSGAEGIARRLFKIFGDSELAPEIINLNPQLARAHLSRSVLDRIRFQMLLEEEDFAGYIKQRRYATDVVQDLKFEDDIFDMQISTWGFPKCMFDCWEDYYVYDLNEWEHAQQGYREIIRTQAVGGIALLAPVMLGNEVRTTNSYLEALSSSLSFSYEFRPTHGSSTVLRLQKEVENP